MRASEFIKVIQKAIDEHGDLEVAVYDPDNGFKIKSTLYPILLRPEDADYFYHAGYDRDKNRFDYYISGKKEYRFFEDNTIFML